jgi:hypothetical protein
MISFKQYQIVYSINNCNNNYNRWRKRRSIPATLGNNSAAADTAILPITTTTTTMANLGIP